jgi:Flp pilus assembly protein TadG
MRRLVRGFGADRRGASTVEFALVMSAFILVSVGILDVGLVLWARNTLQSAASLTARCVSIGSSACSDPGAYAVGLVQQWGLPGMITPSDVTVTSSSTCNGAPGTYTVVTIVSSYWQGSLISPWIGQQMSVSDCYPTSTGFS